jgi:hypothetical protein
MNNQYKTLAKKALDVLEIKYRENAPFNELITIIENSYSLVASNTEIELKKIVNTLAEKLRNKEDLEGIETLLRELKDNYHFSKYWD